MERSGICSPFTKYKQRDKSGKLYSLMLLPQTSVRGALQAANPNLVMTTA